jgi:microcystin-dependent protein
MRCEQRSTSRPFNGISRHGAFFPPRYDLWRQRPDYVCPARPPGSSADKLRPRAWPYYDLGQVGGSESVTLTTSQMPAHTHQLPAHTHQAPAHTHQVTAVTDSASTSIPTNNLPASALRGTNYYAPPSANTTTMAPTMIQSGGVLDTASAQPVIQAAGPSQPFDNSMTYLTLNYCIALEGIFPSRS